MLHEVNGVYNTSDERRTFNHGLPNPDTPWCAENINRFYDYGYTVFPLPRGRKEPTPTGVQGKKNPEMLSREDALSLVEPDRETANAFGMQRWYRNTPHDIAIRFPLGYVGVDLDFRNGAEECAEFLEDLRDAGLDPDRIIFGRSGRTLEDEGDPRDGHYIFRVPQEVTKWVDIRGVDFRTHGHSFLVAAPSQHKSGGVYTLANPLKRLSDHPEMPEALIEKYAAPEPSYAPETSTEVVSGDSRHATYASKVLEAECARIVDAPDGEQNNQINKSAYSVGRLLNWGVFDEDTARARLLQAASDGNHPEGRARNSVRSGLDAGMRSPKGPLPEREEVTGDKIYPGWGEPYAVAQQLSRTWVDDLGNKLLIRRGLDWYRYNGLHWFAVADEIVRGLVYQELRDAFRWEAKPQTKKEKDEGIPPEFELVPWNPAANNVSFVLDALRDTARVGSLDVNNAHQLDVWIGHGDGDHVASLVPLKNGLFDLDTRTLYPHGAGFFNLSVIDAAYDPNAPYPRNFMKGLHAQWDPVTHADQIETLFDFMGYFISGCKAAQKGLILVGPAGSWKGTTTRCLEKMMGRSSVGALNLAGLKENFGLEQAVGKKLLISHDTVTERIKDPLARQRMLEMTGDDDMEIPRKYQSPWVGKLGNVMLVGNAIPTFQDGSGALNKRWIVLQTTRGFRGTSEEDPGMEAAALQETSALFNLALDGYDRVKARGWTFTQPKSAQSTVDEFRRTKSALATFLEEFAVIDGSDDTWISKDALYEAYRAYCEDSGVSNPGTKVTFGTELLAASEYQVRTDGNPRRRLDERMQKVYLGIRLRIEEEPEPFAYAGEPVSATVYAVASDRQSTPVF